MTGNGVGTQWVAPAAYIHNKNFNIIYRGAEVNITAAELTLTVTGQSTITFGQTPVWQYTLTGFEYNDVAANVYGGQLNATYTNSTGQIVSLPLAAGTYTVNFSITLFEGADYVVKPVASKTLVVSPKTVSVTPDPVSIVYGADESLVPYTFTTNDPTLPPASFSGKLSRTNPLVKNVGPYNFTIGTLAVTSDPNNYVITVVTTPNKFVITPRPISITATDKTINYGDPVGALAYTVTSGAFVAGESASGSLGVSPSPAVNVGLYNIVQNGLTVSTNYLLTYIPGRLTIQQVNLTTVGGVYFITEGTATPSFVFTYQGLKYNDKAGTPQAIEPLPPSPLAPGTYTIMPRNTTVFAGTQNITGNYNLLYTAGILYVNPEGPGTKRIRPILDCVTDLGAGTTPYRYVANFRYENQNTVAVYIPLGNLNKISGRGFDPTVTPPVVFLPGGGVFQLPFDGSKIQWQITSFDGTRNSSSTQDASSSSNKCNAGGGTMISLPNIAAAPAMLDEMVTNNVYPNPVKTRVTIAAEVAEKDLGSIRIFDIQGRMFKPLSARRISAKAVELDLTNLAKGQYLIRLNTTTAGKAFKIIKD
jgi:hypothetical protein